MQSQRNAFTLVELLVVIAIIGILIALLLPAVQSAREAARRMQCTNNAKQIALALHNYHTAHSCFPPGQYVYIDANAPNGWNRWSWFASLLPYVEQQALADQYTKHIQNPTGSFSYTNLPGKETAIAMFMCPSDSANPKTTCGAGTTNQQGFHGNYMLNAGDSFFNEGGYANSTQLNGLFYVFSSTRIADIRDGTSNTLMVSEIILVPDGPIGSEKQDVRGRYHNVRHAGALFSTLYAPNTSQPDRFNYCLNNLDEAPCVNTGTDIVVSARSYHPGGVVSALADGSVRFLTEGINAETYQALGTRAGGEVIHGEF